MKIAFLAYGPEVDLELLKKKPMGGTESALVYMAHALAKRGHDVHVFLGERPERKQESVFYHPTRSFETHAQKNHPDILICLRHLLPLMVKRWAPVQIYFSPDAHDQSFPNAAFHLSVQTGEQAFEVGLYSLRKVQKQVDAVFCVGHWQAATFVEKFRIDPKKVHVVGNGVDFNEFRNNTPLEKREKRLVYCSTPFRGLEYLLDYFPEIRKRVPGSELVLMTGMQIYGLSSEQDQESYGHVYEKAKQPGIVFCGPMAKPQMAAMLRTCRVLAYPNTFAETFCIAVLEAQASGLPVVTTALGGLKERVTDGKDGFLIPGHPSLPEYRETFIQKTAELLLDDGLWQCYSEQAIRKAATFDYDLLSGEWEERFLTLLKKESPKESREFFIPHEESASILVNGYPKQVILSQAIILKQISLTLSQMGLRETAHSLLVSTKSGGLR